MTNNLFSLEGRTALVTGSAQGLGNVIARGMMDAGAKVVLSDVSGEALQRARDALKAENRDAPAYVFDITDEPGVTQAVAAIERDVNLSGAFIVGRAVARGMIARRYGKIVNISSINAVMVRPGIGNYCAAKGGIVSLTKSMATEWGEYNINVNAIGPGYFLTDLTRPLAENPEFDAWVKSEVPLRRWGDPKDIIGLAVMLASPASDYISGQTIYLDGGWQACL